MKERPILFNGDMVRAILSGAKTQTRRPVKGVDAKNWIQEPRTGFGTHVIQAADRGCCPFGVPGDRLWVREAFVEIAGRAHHRAGGNLHFDGKPYTGKWTPSIHMPRWACRITLDVTEVRVERVRDITEEDARAEGFESRDAFIGAWDGIYGAGNPWVWAVTFKATP